MTPDEDHLRDFWWWVNERQRIWVRRRVEDLPPPWTENGVLQDYHFCNVHRELDAATQYALREILRSPDEADVLFNTVWYRFLNRPDSFEQQGGFTPATEWDADRAVARLNGQESVFSPAYRVTSHDWAGADSKVENICYGIIRDELQTNLDAYTAEVFGADSLKGAHSALTRLPGVGDFLAYEIVTDLCYRHLPFSEDDWVNVGPGAATGLEWIFGRSDLDALRWLQTDQDRWIQNYPWPTRDRLDEAGVEGTPKTHLTLRDLEHAACEWRKYRQILENEATKRRFSPGLAAWHK